MNFVPMHDDEFVFSWGFMIKIVWDILFTNSYTLHCITTLKNA